MLNVFSLMQWRFDLLIPAQSPQFGTFVNPRMATLTRGSSQVELKPLQSTRESAHIDLKSLVTCQRLNGVVRTRS